MEASSHDRSFRWPEMALARIRTCEPWSRRFIETLFASSRGPLHYRERTPESPAVHRKDSLTGAGVS